MNNNNINLDPDQSQHHESPLDKFQHINISSKEILSMYEAGYIHSIRKARANDITADELSKWIDVLIKARGDLLSK
jgi:hypothetical protein